MHDFSMKNMKLSSIGGSGSRKIRLCPYTKAGSDCPSLRKDLASRPLPELPNTQRIPMQLKDSVFLITGGASGLGAASARMAVDNGAKVVIADVQDGTP